MKPSSGGESNTRNEMKRWFARLDRHVCLAAATIFEKSSRSSNVVSRQTVLKIMDVRSSQAGFVQKMEKPERSRLRCLDNLRDLVCRLTFLVVVINRVNVIVHAEFQRVSLTMIILSAAVVLVQMVGESVTR